MTDAPSSPGLPPPSPSNFRDLADAVHPRVPLRRGRLFRSDHLGRLTSGDVERLQALQADFAWLRERV